MLKKPAVSRSESLVLDLKKKKTKMEQIKRDVIKKHLEGWGRDLKNTSIEHFAKSGKVSGSFFIALKDMLDDYVEQFLILNNKKHGQIKSKKVR